MAENRLRIRLRIDMALKIGQAVTMAKPTRDSGCGHTSGFGLRRHFTTARATFSGVCTSTDGVF